ncbi:MAG: haloacid dehalogenase [Desulfurococcaceae archaeon]
MEYLVEGISEVVEKDLELIESLLTIKDKVREEAIRVSREITRLSTEAIRLVHLRKFNEAGKLLNEASVAVKSLLEKLSDHPDLMYCGLIYGCLAEYVEARMLFDLTYKRKLTGLQELGVPYIPYLQGLGDVVGELRRLAIDLIKAGSFNEASLYIDVMEEIYQRLKKLSFPDALTPGLRHKVDVARRLIEDTKTLFINAYNASKLMEKLDLKSGYSKSNNV